MDRLIIAKFLLRFLPYSETFVYAFIRNTKRFEQIIIADKRENEDQFPYDSSKVFIFDKPDKNILNAEISLKHKFLLNMKNRYFYNVLRVNNVSLIHAHFGYVGVSALACAKRLKIPLVTSFHGLDMSKLGRDLYYRIMYKELFTFGKAFIAEGSYMRKKLIELGCHEDKARIIHIGADLRGIPFIPRRIRKGDKIRLLICSRFVEKKGIPYGIKAFAGALQTNRNMELNIIGGESRAYQALIDQLGVGENIKILGRMTHSDLIGYMQNSHIFLAPSVTARDGDSEGGAPTIVIEASASGMPIISSFHADIPEVVIDGKTGLLSPERDVDALTRNILTIANNPELIVSMGQEGRKHIEGEYDIVKETAKLEKLYDQIIHK